MPQAVAEVLDHLGVTDKAMKSVEFHKTRSLP